MKVLIVDNYDSFTFNLYHYITQFTDNVDVVKNDKIQLENIAHCFGNVPYFL